VYQVPNQVTAEQLLKLYAGGLSLPKQFQNIRSSTAMLNTAKMQSNAATVQRLTCHCKQVLK
jgi:hypothetical protein